MKQPITNAIKEHISTAPALRSLIVFIVGFLSIEIKSHKFSIDELMVSNASTPPINKRITHHSQT